MKNLLPATIVAKINNQEIVVINQDGEKRVAVKPICDALGIDWPSQLRKLKSDRIFKEVISLSRTVGADGKHHEMVTIPVMYVFGWIFTIHPTKVAPEAKESIIRNKKECYDAIWNFYYGSEF